MLICGDHWPSRLQRVLAGAELGHRLLQHLLVELEADFPDMAGLLVAQQVARAAHVEIVAGQLEAGAQRVERLQHLQPLARRRRSACLLAGVVNSA